MEKRSFFSSLDKENKWVKYIEKAVSKGVMTPADADLISSYITWKISDVGISGRRQTKIYQCIKQFRQRLDCEFSDLTEDAWRVGIMRIRQEDYADSTKSDIIGLTKPFLYWAIERGHIPNLTKKTVKSVKTPKAPMITKTPDELPTRDEIYKLIQHPRCTIQQQALLTTAYYTGMRIGEIFAMNWEDVVFKDKSVTIRVADTKTKKYRYVPAVEILPYMAAWRRQYPASFGVPEGNNPVFIVRNQRNGKYKRMEYGAANMFLRRLQEACGLKHFSWHTFRAANITNCAMAGVPDAVIKDIHWGNQSSQMLQTYVLISDDAKEREMYKRAGIEVEEEKVLNIPQTCPSCCALNGPGDHYCRLCGYPLSASASAKQRMIGDAVIYAQQHYSLEERINAMASQLGISKEKVKQLLTGGL